MSGTLETDPQHLQPDKESKEYPAPPRYFENMSIREVYGDYRVLPGTGIVSDIPNGAPPDQFPTDEEREEIMKQYNLTNVGGWGNSDQFTGSFKNLIIYTGIDHGKTVWASMRPERKLLLDLAHTITGERPPLILDVGCRNGFLAKLLAYSSDAKVVGTNYDDHFYGQLPDTRGDIKLLKRDIYDLVAEYGPPRTSEELNQLLSIVNNINGPREEDWWRYLYYLDHPDGYVEFGKGLETENTQLQQLAANHQDAPVDMVICSHMPEDTDLTPVIRDGIHPKAIAYIIETKGVYGPYVGDYYSSVDADGKYDSTADQVVYFNPGYNYRTVARWNTFGRENWRDYAHFHRAERRGSEVVIQLRNDVHLQELQDSEIPACTWDFELKKMFWYHPYKDFVGDVEQARQDIVKN